MATKKTPSAVKTKTANGDVQPQRIGALPGEPPDVDVPDTMTKEEAEAHIRGLHLVCQGPRHEPSMKQWQTLMAAGNADEARKVRTRGLMHPDGYLVPCGYDFGETVRKYPFDGADHTDTCPKCGTETFWRSPVITITK